MGDVREVVRGKFGDIKANKITIPLNWLWPILAVIATAAYSIDVRMDNKISEHYNLDYHKGAKIMVDERTKETRIVVERISDDVSEMKRIWQEHLVQSEARIVRLESENNRLKAKEQ